MDGKHLGVEVKNRARHQKYRAAKARAMWQVVKRLSRLPPKEKKQVACGEILQVLTWGGELYHQPLEEQKRLVAEISR